MRVKDIIVHLFDYHVMEKRDWTLEQLVAWVETWEPKINLSGDVSLEILEQRSQSQTANKSRGEEEVRATGRSESQLSRSGISHGGDVAAPPPRARKIGALIYKTNQTLLSC
jgi:hypothetical protein